MAHPLNTQQGHRYLSPGRSGTGRIFEGDFITCCVRKSLMRPNTKNLVPKHLEHNKSLKEHNSITGR